MGTKPAFRRALRWRQTKATESASRPAMRESRAANARSAFEPVGMEFESLRARHLSVT
jgi:hypothetical protein